MRVDDAIKLSIDNVLKEGLTDVDIFSRPFELNMLKNKEIKNRIISEIERSFQGNDLKSLGITPIAHLLVPKKELFDFRKCALVQPLDELKYLSLVLQIAEDIESMRINKNKKIVFSYRFKPQNGYLFDPKFNYTTFREYVSKKAKQKNVKVMVSCDIGNFYDRLNLHRLESILRSNKKIDSDVVHKIGEILSFWSNRDSYGLPVGSNASRILAEASLIEVDNYLVSKKVTFCRFVDDYRIFAKDSATAHYWLSLLVDKLNQEGLFLNTSKTRIKDVTETENYYKAHAEDSEDPLENSQTKIGEDASLGSKFNTPKIIRGYSGLIPTKFRKQTDSEKSRLLKNDIKELYRNIENSVLIDPKAFVEVIKTAIAQEDAGYLVTLVKRLDRFPQFLPYILDAITKYEVLFSDEHVQILTDELKGWLGKESFSEYIFVYLIRFFGFGRFTNKEILLEYFRALKTNPGNYTGRAVLEELEKSVSSEEVLEIRDYYAMADAWEKREIAKIVEAHIKDEEKQSFFKNILDEDNDIFLSGINKTRRKRK